jgi:hypothetical protein
MSRNMAGFLISVALVGFGCNHAHSTRGANVVQPGETSKWTIVDASLVVSHHDAKRKWASAQGYWQLNTPAVGDQPRGRRLR